MVEEMQTNETMEHLNETKDELERVRKTLLRTEEDRDMWRRLFEDCNKKHGEEIERVRQENKERTDRLRLASLERSLPAGSVPRGQSPVELLKLRELKQATNLQIQTAPNRVTIFDPSDTLADPVGERTMQQLVEAAGRLVASRGVPSFGMTAPNGTIHDTGRVELSSEVVKKTGAATVTRLAKNLKNLRHQDNELPMKKVSHVFDIQKNNQFKNSFTGVPDTDLRAGFNQST